jgi:CTP-dependent riboflavin kinase
VIVADIPLRTTFGLEDGDLLAVELVLGGRSGSVA